MLILLMCMLMCMYDCDGHFYVILCHFTVLFVCLLYILLSICSFYSPFPSLLPPHSPYSPSFQIAKVLQMGDRGSRASHKEVYMMGLVERVRELAFDGFYQQVIKTPGLRDGLPVRVDF